MRCLILLAAALGCYAQPPLANPNQEQQDFAAGGE